MAAYGVYFISKISLEEINNIMVTKSRKTFRALVVLSLIISMVLSSVSFSFADTVSPHVRRIYGENRYQTAIRVANALKKELKVTKFSNIVVASGSNFADALAGTYLAINKKAPILLASNGNYNETVNYIKSNLRPDGTVYILGGTGVINDKVESSIKNTVSSSTKVLRLSGSNRYETNLAILKETKVENTDFLICSGKNFPDALAAAAVGKPIILVSDRLDNSQLSYIKNALGSKSRFYIIGGTGAVPAAVETQLKQFGKTIRRLKGQTRYSTAVQIAYTFYPKARRNVTVTGESFPDGLTGAVLANAMKAPLLLTSMTPKFQTSYKYNMMNNIRNVTILGGIKVVATPSTGLTKEANKITGFFKVGDYKYYATKDYKIAKNKFIDVHGKKYYGDEEGKIVTNKTFTINGNVYQANADGVLTQPSKVIYLTFDDGPGPYTSELINILDKYNAKATFFVKPNRPEYNYCLKRASQSGHAIGNHTYSHNYSYVYSSTYNFWSEIEKADAVIREQTGKGTKLIRFPGGSSNTVSRNYSYGIVSTLARQMTERGYAYFDWNVDSNDAGGATTSGEVYRNIINGVSANGSTPSVVLCHDIHYYTVNAIEDVIRWGQRNGYVFLPLTTSSPTAHHSIAN